MLSQIMSWVADPNHLTLLVTLFIALWQVSKSVLRWLAPRTKTTVDDSVLAFMGKAEAMEECDWVRDMAPGFFAQAESLGKKGELGSGIGKLAYYVLVARDAYQAAKGKPISAAGEILLKQYAGKLAAQQKLLPGAAGLDALASDIEQALGNPPSPAPSK